MMKRPIKPATALAGIALIALVVFLAWSWTEKSPTAQNASAGQNAPVRVTTVAAGKQDVPLYLGGMGAVTANASVTVKVQINGQLQKVGFSEGQDVKAGQLLAQIDPRPLQAQLEQYQAMKAKDQAQLANAQLDLQRYVTLAQQNSVAQQTLDTQRATVAQYAAAVKTDQAQINYETVQLGYTTIRAPLSGRVGARLVDPGNVVQTSDANGLVVINQVDPIVAVFTLPEQNFQAINSAINASRKPLIAEAYDHNTGKVLASGQLTMVNNQIDTGSGTVQLKAHFTNPKHQLWPGQYVDVRLYLGTSHNAITVPDAAIMRAQSGTYVYMVGAGNHALRQPVRIDRIQDGIAVIATGISAGTRVVVDGQYKLKSGSLVTEAAGKGASL